MDFKHNLCLVHDLVRPTRCKALWRFPSIVLVPPGIPLRSPLSTNRKCVRCSPLILILCPFHFISLSMSLSAALNSFRQITYLYRNGCCNEIGDVLQSWTRNDMVVALNTLQYLDVSIANLASLERLTPPRFRQNRRLSHSPHTQQIVAYYTRPSSL